MHLLTLCHLICPYCGDSLHVKKRFISTQYTMSYGIVACSCTSFPIVEGILVLKKTTYMQDVIQLLEQHRYQSAFTALCELESTFAYNLLEATSRIYIPHFDNIKNRILRSIKKIKFLTLKKIVLSQDFSSLSKKIYLSDVADYHLYRMPSDSYISTQSYLSHVNGSGWILDLACGMGAFSRLFSHYYNTEKIMSVDQSFLSLFLGKIYYPHKGQCIAMDITHGLPFPDHFFTLTFNADSFHYFPQKKLVSSEVLRVLQNQGSLLFVHLHNNKTENQTSGASLSSEGYYKLFHKRKPLILDPEISFSSQITGKKFSLKQTAITFQPAIDILSVSKLPTTLISPSLMSPYYINPLYTVLSKRDHLHLHRSFPSLYFEKDNPLVCKYLPRNITIPLLPLPDSTFKKLAEQNIILPLPSRLFEKQLLVTKK